MLGWSEAIVTEEAECRVRSLAGFSPLVKLTTFTYSLCNALCDDDNLSYCGGGYPAAFSLYELKRKTSSRRHLLSDMH